MMRSVQRVSARNLAVGLCLVAVLAAGQADAAITVEISAPGGATTHTLPDEGGNYAADVALGRNMVNSVLVTAKDAYGNTAERRVSITQVSLADVVISEFTSERLPLERIEQLVEDGVIDLDAPENYNVSEFTMVLTIDKREVPVSIPIATPKMPEEPNGFEVYRFPFGDGDNGGRQDPRQIEIVVFEKPIPSEPGQPAPPPVPGVLIIEGRIKSLKEFFSCHLILMNASGIFTLSDVVAEIDFPEGGLSNVLPADGIASFGDILPGEGGLPGQIEKEFIIRGDAMGVRPVDVRFGGFVTGPGIPEDAPIPFNGSASTTVEVKGPPSFQVQVFHPDFVVSGMPYDMRVDITNTGELPALYASLDIDVAGMGELLECDYDAKSLKADCPPVPGPVTRALGHIFPGETTSEIFTIVPNESGQVSSCVAASDQNITLQVYAGTRGCLAGHYPPLESAAGGAPAARLLPAPNTMNVGLDTPVVAFFSEIMRTSSITTGQGGSFNVFDGDGALLPGVLHFDTLYEGTGRERTLAMWQYQSAESAKLPANSTLRAVVTTAVTDVTGQPLAAECASSFTTTGEDFDDNDAPALTLSVEPPVDPNFVLPGEQVRINAYAGDQGSGVARVEARIKDLDQADSVFVLIDQKRVAAGELPPFIFTLDSANLVFGHAYQFRATAYDFNGNAQDATIGLVVADSAAAPAIALPADPASPWLHGIALDVTPKSISGSVRNVTYYLDGAEAPFATATLRPFQAYLRTLDLALGGHSVRAVATDGLGQTGEDTLDFQLTENLNMPTVSFGSAVDGAKYVVGSTFPVNITVEDPVGIASVRAFLDEAKGNPVTTGTSTFTIDTAGLALGIHRISVHATNLLGVSNDPGSPEATLEFIVADPAQGAPPAPPVVTEVSYPEDGAVTVEGTAPAGGRVDLTNTTLGVALSVYADASGQFHARIAAGEGDVLRLVAYDFGQSLDPSDAVIATVPVRAALQRIEADPADIAFTSLNAYRDLTVRAFYEDGSVVNVTKAATFQTNAPAVARVSAEGRVAPVANGSAAVSVSAVGATVYVNVNVNVVYPTHIAVEPATVNLIAIGQTQTLTTRLHYSDGSSTVMNSGVAYSSGDRAVATVNSSGVITAVHDGTTKITVSVSGMTPATVPVSVVTVSDPAPTVEILSPANGAAYERGGSVAVNVRAQDAAGGVTRVYLQVSGALSLSDVRQVSPPALDTLQSFTFAVSATAPLGGTFTATIYAEDTSGKTSATAQVTLTVVDATAPQVSVEAPEFGAAFNYGDSIELRIAAADAGGIARIRYAMTGGLEGGGYQDFPAVPQSAEAAFSIPVPYGVDDPDVRIVAYAVDQAGNEGSSAPLDVVIADADITPPETVATGVSAPGASASTTVSYQVLSGLDDLDHVELFFRRNGHGTFNRYTRPDAGNPQGEFHPQNGAAGTIVFDSTRMGGDGHFELYTVGVDRAGNREAAPDDGAKTLVPDKEVDIHAGTVWTAIGANTEIGVGDTSFDGKNLRIDAATVTVSGHHAFQNIELLNGGKLTHPETDLASEYALDLSAWTVTVDASSAIDADSRGYLGGKRNGNGDSGRTVGNVEGSTFRSAGSHAGRGAANEGVPNAPYGNLVTPGDLGSGGSRGWYSEPGGDGGGRVQIQAINVIVDGRVSANGGQGGGSDAGSGAGGSLYFVVNTLSGRGQVAANGGGYQLGGGGGRVAVHFVDMSTMDTSLIQAIGGQGSHGDGGNGTVFLKGPDDTNGTLVVDGQGVASAYTTLPIPPGYVFDNIVLQNSARVVADDPLVVSDTLRVLTSSILTHSLSDEDGLQIEAGHVFVDDTSRIDVSEKGYRGGKSGGNTADYGLTLHGQEGATFRSAGSYGGVGARNEGAPNPAYGHPGDAVYLGSGGSRGWYGEAGGNGGGRLTLVAHKSVVVNGAIWANGGPGQGSDAGSGSGGSLDIDTALLKGYGTIAANGGGYQLGGGGGRVHIRYAALGVSGNNLDGLRDITAFGGRGSHGDGSAGTVLMQRTDQADGDLYVDDNRVDGEGAPNATAPVHTPLVPITFGPVQAVTSDTLTTDGLVAALPGGLVGIEINPNVNQTQTYVITANTADTISVDTAGKPALSAVTSVGDTCVGVYRFDNVYFRRGGALVTGDRVVVNGTMRIAEFGMLTHFDATASREFHLDLTVDGLEVLETGSIDVDYCGYLGGKHNNGDDFGRTLGNVAGASFRSAASHGGAGAANDGAANPIYGSLTFPEVLGSGGSRGWYGETGGDGGGRLQIHAGTLTVDGVISANGEQGHGSDAGSGSGGSIVIEADVLDGNGYVRANGGGYQLGGGGGRIALFYGTLSLDQGRIEAVGGQGSHGDGGNGTVFLKSAAQSRGDLIVDGLGQDTPAASTRVPGGYTFDNLTVRNKAQVVADDEIRVTGALNVLTGSVLTHSVSHEPGLRIEAASVYVDADSVVSATSKGYRGGKQPGNSADYGLTLGNLPGATFRSAGSFGGLGAAEEGTPNPVYGHPADAIYLGSGGSRGWYGELGGNGGGLVTIIAPSEVHIAGAVRADGGNGGGSYAGSGSGGSIAIVTGLFHGSGVVSANGGAYQRGGGGGRIVIEYATLGGAGDDFNGLRGITAFGGAASKPGSAGTVLFRDGASVNGDLYIDGNSDTATAGVATPLTLVGFGEIAGLAGDTITTNGVVAMIPNGLIGIEINPNIEQGVTYPITSNTATEITVDTAGKPLLTTVASVGDKYTGVFRFDNVRFRRGGFLMAGDRLVVGGTVTVDEFGVLTHYDATANFESRLDLAAGSIHIASSGAIDVSYRGYLGGKHNGSGDAGLTLGNVAGASFRSAGSYGGLGGAVEGTPNAVYGSEPDPAALGSGGSRGWYSEQGGDGGGWAHIECDALTVDGRLAANGENGHGSQAGSGSGGTINVAAESIHGSGAIEADGGAYQVGGGGGRVALRYGAASSDVTELAVSASGGAGNHASGQDGTVHLEAGN